MAYRPIRTARTTAALHLSRGVLPPDLGTLLDGLGCRPGHGRAVGIVEETRPGNDFDLYPELLAEAPAAGGEPCRICGEPIPSRAHPVQKARYVCSPPCNEKLKRLFRRRLNKDKQAHAARIKQGWSTEFPKLRISPPHEMRTVQGEFPYEFDRYPIAGDVVERHGHQTVYLAYLAPQIPQPVRDCFAPWLAAMEIALDDTLFTWHPQSNAIGVTFICSNNGIPRRLALPKLLVDGIFIDHRYHEPISGTGTALDGIYRGSEFISDVDESGDEYRWKAEVFSPVQPTSLWTPARTALSMSRTRATSTRGTYLARTRGMRTAAKEIAHNIDPRQIYERDRWVCQICTQPVDEALTWPDPMSPSLDHVTPVICGGQHVAANMQTSHLICNIRKGNAPPAGADDERLPLTSDT
jgi:hypothetical protein